jgi:hypothetical protein
MRIMSITVRSDAFDEGQRIPVKYAQEGGNVSPPLHFESLPAETQELALIADDPDAPINEPWVHWVLYKIPAGVTDLPEGVQVSPRPPRPAGARQGPNTAGHAGYDGPAPPRGHGIHRYHFKVYALDAELDLDEGADKAALLAAMEGHVLDQGELVGTYSR